jgi:type II secretory pathway pseudopilin PulG
MLQIIVLVIVVIIVAVAGAIFFGNQRWRKNDQQVRVCLLAARQTISPRVYDAREIENLPAPVRRFFSLILTDGQPMITTARIASAGEFSLGSVRNNWRPFKAQQLFTVHRPGFIWDARISMAPGVTAFVRDAYVTGTGVLHAEALGLITVADERNTPELTQSELFRHLAECLWFPTALLPSQGVVWDAIDDTRARATIADGATRVSLEFQFGQDGLIESAITPSRFRTVKGVSFRIQSNSCRIGSLKVAAVKSTGRSYRSIIMLGLRG